MKILSEWQSSPGRVHSKWNIGADEFCNPTGSHYPARLLHRWKEPVSISDSSVPIVETCSAAFQLFS